MCVSDVHFWRPCFRLGARNIYIVEIDKGYQAGLLGKVQGVRPAGMSRVGAHLETCNQEDVTEPKRPSQTLVLW